MGQLISALKNGINTILDDVSKLVTDVTATVGNLTSMTAGFSAVTALSTRRQLAALVPSGVLPPVVTIGVTVGDGDDSVSSALDAALVGASDAASTLFGDKFDGASPAGTDNGVVKGFKANGKDTSSIHDQMVLDFGNWGLSDDPKIADKMIATLKSQMKAKIGQAGTSFGSYTLNRNQKIQWTIAYGEFLISGSGTESVNGLVYAFSAGLKTGWGAAEPLVGDWHDFEPGEHIGDAPGLTNWVEFRNLRGTGTATYSLKIGSAQPVRFELKVGERKTHQINHQSWGAENKGKVLFEYRRDNSATDGEATA